MNSAQSLKKQPNVTITLMHLVTLMIFLKKIHPGVSEGVGFGVGCNKDEKIGALVRTELSEPVQACQRPATGTTLLQQQLMARPERSKGFFIKDGNPGSMNSFYDDTV